MSFQTLGLSNELLQTIAEEGYEHPTPIQQQAIPVLLDGKDLMALAQTGSGKTAAFALPLLHQLQSSPKPNGKYRPTRALILAPTRELAAQIGDSFKTYGNGLPINGMVIFGGVKIYPQIARLHRGADIIVATPGRLLDLVRQDAVDLSHVEIFVCDEVDRMLDMGFIVDIQKIVSLLPRNRQTCLFSATSSPNIQSIAKTFLKNPEFINLSRQNQPLTQIKQWIYPVDRHRKTELLSFIIGSQNLKQVLVFTKTKRCADQLSRSLLDFGLQADSIHGDKNQGARTRALSKFKTGKTQILVATDVAARGIDIDQLPHVVNFELPHVPDDYIHRIGRTGRGGETGSAISLVSPDEYVLLRSIEKLMNYQITKKVIPGYEPAARSHSAPRKAPSRQSQGRKRSFHRG